MKLPYIEIQQDPEDPAIIYNVTTKVLDVISRDWLVWMKEVHIPDILATGCFNNAVILQLTEVDDSEGPTYAVQYAAPSKAMYNRYVSSFAEGMRQKAEAEWGNQIISFRTVLRVVN